MNLTLDEIRQAIANKQITAISLDTSAFERKQLNFERGMLHLIRQFKGSEVAFLLSEIVTREVESHLSRRAEETLARLKNSIDEIAIPWQVSGLQQSQALGVLIPSPNPQTMSQQRLKVFLDSTGATVVKAEEGFSMSELLRRYFEHEKPFSSQKKNEFPDALALLSLESWALARDTQVLVVTHDNDWIGYCADSPRLVTLGDLGQALGCFQKEQASYFCGLIESAFYLNDPLGISSDVSSTLAKSSSEIEVVPEADSQFAFESQWTEVDLSLSGYCTQDGKTFQPVEFDGETLIARAKVLADADISAGFSFAAWDGIDREQVPIGSGSESITDTLEVEMLISFSGEFPDNIAVENVEILPQTIHIHFGEIQPNWLSE